MMNIKRLIRVAVTAILPLATIAQTPNAPKPYGPLPTDAQLKWHETEMYCLIHFTPTTFQNKEWGFGDADPKIFNPARFDANQIAAAAKAGGLNALISVAKHHDGFCLWPTASTSYNISQSPWQNGKGDMVRAFMEAAHKHDMQFGVYCSAWDRNFPGYGKPDYVHAYAQQLRELYNNYGPLFISWHDGANGGDGYYGGANETRTIDRTSYYGWDTLWAITRKLQPLAVIFSDIGPDVRWVGNERGEAGETCWATFTPVGKDGGKAAPGYLEEKFLTSGQRDGQYWIPAECDVPLRKGWFYHVNEDDQVKTPDQLFDLYCKSVGRGACLNLGLAPNTAGLLHASDVASLKAFGAKIKETFARNLASQASFTASNTRASGSKTFAPANLVDKDRYTYWSTDDNITNPELTIALKSPQTFNLVRLRENIKLGQRIDSVTVEAWQDGAWKRIGAATSIGSTRLIRLPKAISAQRLRLKVFAPVSPALSDFGLFMEAKTKGEFARTAPTKGIDKKNWKVIESQHGTKGSMPSVIVDLGEIKKIAAFSYLPQQEDKRDGLIKNYRLDYSADGSKWVTAATGEFSNIAANPVAQYVKLQAPVEARLVRLTALSTINGKSSIALAEIELYE